MSGRRAFLTFAVAVAVITAVQFALAPAVIDAAATLISQY